eukprot:3892239-Amphidinium_carterae.1
MATIPFPPRLCHQLIFPFVVKPGICDENMGPTSEKMRPLVEQRFKQLHHTTSTISLPPPTASPAHPTIRARSLQETWTARVRGCNCWLNSAFSSSWPPHHFLCHHVASSSSRSSSPTSPKMLPARLPGRRARHHKGEHGPYKREDAIAA